MRRYNRSTIHDEQSVGLVEQIVSQNYTRMLDTMVLTTGNQGAAAAEVDVMRIDRLGIDEMSTLHKLPEYMINGQIYYLSTVGSIQDICAGIDLLSTPHHAEYELGTDATTNTPVTAAAFAAGSGGLVGSVSAPFCYVLFTLLTSGTGWCYRGAPAVSTGAAEIPLCPENECPISVLLLNVRNMSTGAAGPTIKYDWTHDLSSHSITDAVHGLGGAIATGNTFTLGLPVSYYTHAINHQEEPSLTAQS